MLHQVSPLANLLDLEKPCLTGTKTQVMTKHDWVTVTYDLDRSQVKCTYEVI